MSVGSAWRTFSCTTWAACAWRKRKAFPSLATPGHPLSPVRLAIGLEAPTARRLSPSHNGPIKILVPTTSREGWCLPENLGAFHRLRQRRGPRIAPHTHAVRPPSHAAHTSRVLHEGAFFGALQAPLGR